MRIGRALTGVLVAGGLAVTTLAPTAPAGAVKPEKSTYTDSFSFRDPNYCDVPGLKVRIRGVVEGVLLVRTRHGLEYFTDHQKVTATHTLGGVTVTVKSNPMFKDLKIVDQGDTLLITGFGTGPESTYGPDGKAIARNPGQFRFQLRVDEQTGEEIQGSFTILKESTGRTDDFCAAVLPVLQG